MNNKAPRDLGQDGKALWRQLTQDYDFTGNEALLHELARTADRLAEVRVRIMGAPDDSTYAKLAGLEVKVSATFARLWRIAGIPQAETPRRDNAAR
jgi:hypothetical protein